MEFVIIGAGIMVTRSFKQPMKELMKLSNDQAQRNLTTAKPTTRKDELGVLTNTFYHLNST